MPAVAEESQQKPKAQRISRVMAELDLSPEKVAEVCGVHPDTAKRWQKAENEPYSKYLDMLSDAFDVRQHWLRTGEGEMLAPSAGDGAQKEPHSASEGKAGEVAQQEPRDAIYDVTASMGDGSFEIGEEIVGHISGDDALSRPGREVFWIFVRGDSMGDTFAKHTMVPVVRFDRPLDDLQGDDVYFFRLEGAVQIKRLQRLPGDRIAVISDNDKYARYEIPLNDGIDFEILGRVIA
jgi:phage repressor protein C with HTH and peptisase S24 domain